MNAPRPRSRPCTYRRTAAGLSGMGLHAGRRGRCRHRRVIRQRTGSATCQGQSWQLRGVRHFLLRGGDQLPGAVQVDQLGTKRLFTPILIHAAGKSLDPLASDITPHLARLRKSAAEPPVRWRLNVTLPGDQVPASGRISRLTYSAGTRSAAQDDLVVIHLAPPMNTCKAATRAMRLFRATAA